MAKLKIFNGTNIITFTDNKIPIERTSYNCIPAINIDSVLRIYIKRSYPQAYLEQCKYKLKKRIVVNFIDDEIKGFFEAFLSLYIKKKIIQKNQR